MAGPTLYTYTLTVTSTDPNANRKIKNLLRTLVKKSNNIEYFQKVKLSEVLDICVGKPEKNKYTCKLSWESPKPRYKFWVELLRIMSELDVKNSFYKMLEEFIITQKVLAAVEKALAATEKSLAQMNFMPTE